MSKLLFITILFGAMLVVGVVYAEKKGDCYCDIEQVEPKDETGANNEFNIAQDDVEDEKTCLQNYDTYEDPETGQIFLFTNCNWNPTTKPTTPKSPSGGTAPAGTGGISTPPVKAEEVKLENPLGEGRTDIKVILGEIIKYAMGILGSLTLLVFVFGGFLWLTSAGNDERVKKGSQTMLWAVIGIFIIFASYGILTLVLKAIGAIGVN